MGRGGNNPKILELLYSQISTWSSWNYFILKNGRCGVLFSKWEKGNDSQSRSWGNYSQSGRRNFLSEGVTILKVGGGNYSQVGGGGKLSNLENGGCIENKCPPHPPPTSILPHLQPYINLVFLPAIRNRLQKNNDFHDATDTALQDQQVK